MERLQVGREPAVSDARLATFPVRRSVGEIAAERKTEDSKGACLRLRPMPFLHCEAPLARLTLRKNPWQP